MGAVATKLSQREIFVGTTTGKGRMFCRGGGGQPGGGRALVPRHRAHGAWVARAERCAQSVCASRSRSIRVSVVRSSRLSAWSTSTRVETQGAILGLVLPAGLDEAVQADKQPTISAPLGVLMYI